MGNGVLAKEGILVFSISHPCFAAPGHGWVRDGEGEQLCWKVDRHFDGIALKARKR